MRSVIYCVIQNDFTGNIVREETDKAAAIHWAVANSRKRKSGEKLTPNRSGVILKNVVAITAQYVVERVHTA